MPTVLSMKLPVPSNWQEFESMTRDALAQRWQSPDLEKNGRSGQKQHGVDVWGPDHLGRPVGVQCKRFAQQLKKQDVIKEIAEAEAFSGHLTTLFLATTTDQDAKLQQMARKLSEERALVGKFAVAFLFWDDIVSGLALNPEVFNAHYPNVALKAPASVDKERLVAALEFGYYGADLWQYVVLVYGEIGQMVQADPDELIATLRVLERRAQQLLPSTEAEPIVKALNQIRDGCAAPKSEESGWHEVEFLAKRASTRISKASSFLALAESNILDLSFQLGRIYHHLDDLPGAGTRASIQTKIRAALAQNGGSSLDQSFDDAATLPSGFEWARRMYGLLDRGIRYGVA